MEYNPRVLQMIQDTLDTDDDGHIEDRDTRPQKTTIFPHSITE